MPARVTRRDADKVAKIGQAPDGSGGIGALGVDLATHEAQLSDFALRQGDRVRFDGALRRAKGTKRLYTFTNTMKARTFGADAKYATFTPPLIPAGGFAVMCHFTTVEPSSPNVAYIVGARPNGQTYHVFRIIYEAAIPGPGGSDPPLTISWRDSGGTTRTVAGTVVASTVVHLLAIYDAVAGTFTVYVNGSVFGTPLTGLAATLKPVQDTGVVWTFGVQKETSVAVTANSHFDGPIDGFAIHTLRGLDISSGSPSFLDTLRKWQFAQWPSPQAPHVLAHYGMDEASGTAMYDRSNAKNHGTYVGTPTVSNPVALSFPNGNYVGVFERANGQHSNLVGVGGGLFYETIRSASA